MKHTNIRRKVITTVILLAVGILFLLPLLWMISSSLKPGSEVFSTNFTWIPSKFVWKTYEQVLTSKSVPFLNMIKNSLVLATATIVGQLLVSSLAAYAFACIDFKGKNIVFIMLLGAMMIPSQATLIPRFTLFNSMGLYNTHWALLLPSWFSVSAVLLLRQFYKKIPRDLVEAAVIDGARSLSYLVADHDAADQDRYGLPHHSGLYRILERLPYTSDLPDGQGSVYGIPWYQPLQLHGAGSYQQGHGCCDCGYGSRHFDI